MVHGVRNAINLNPNKVLVSLDLKNAFNSVKREAFFAQVKEKFPRLLG